MYSQRERVARHACATNKSWRAVWAAFEASSCACAAPRHICCGEPGIGRASVEALPTCGRHLAQLDVFYWWSFHVGSGARHAPVNARSSRWESSLRALLVGYRNLRAAGRTPAALRRKTTSKVSLKGCVSSQGTGCAVRAMLRRFCLVPGCARVFTICQRTVPGFARGTFERCCATVSAQAVSRRASAGERASVWLSARGG